MLTPMMSETVTPRAPRMKVLMRDSRICWLTSRPLTSDVPQSPLTKFSNQVVYCSTGLLSRPS